MTDAGKYTIFDTRRHATAVDGINTDALALATLLRLAGQTPNVAYVWRRNADGAAVATACVDGEGRWRLVPGTTSHRHKLERLQARIAHAQTLGQVQFCRLRPTQWRASVAGMFGDDAGTADQAVASAIVARANELYGARCR